MSTPLLFVRTAWALSGLCLASPKRCQKQVKLDKIERTWKANNIDCRPIIVNRVYDVEDCMYVAPLPIAFPERDWNASRDEPPVAADEASQLLLKLCFTMLCHLPREHLKHNPGELGVQVNDDIR
jgi:hypothetical protein